MLSNHLTDTTKTSTKTAFFVPILPVIFFFLHNFNLFKELLLTKETLWLLLIYSIAIFLINLLIKRIFKLSRLQSAFLATLLVVFFLFFGVLQDFFLGLKGFAFLSNSLFLTVSFLLIEVFLLAWIKKKKSDLVKPVKYFVVVFLIFIAIEMGNFVITIYHGRTINSITQKMTPPLLINNKTSESERPDIYHIVFDSYTNAPSLKQYWGYENNIYPFLDSSGFYTLDSGFSNYSSTPYSISSIFNLQYLQGAEEFLNPNSANFYIGNRAYHNNVLFKFLEKQRYRFSIFSVLESEKRLLELGYLAVSPPASWLRKQTLERIYLNPWIMHKIKNLFSKGGRLPGPVLESMQHFRDYNKDAVDHIFSDCKNAQHPEQSPVFSFTHIMLPHAPYLVDENGTYIASPEPDGTSKEGYMQQLKYANKLIRQITNCLLSDTTRNKIIIFQGDHGFRQHGKASYTVKFGALNAIYFYNKNYKGLKKELSLVNTYRIVINNVYGGHLPLLKDSIVAGKGE